MQDLLALSDKYSSRPATEETINDPTVRKHYWRYRCHVTLEALQKDKGFLATLQQQLLSAPLLHSAHPSDKRAGPAAHSVVFSYALQRQLWLSRCLTCTLITHC